MARGPHTHTRTHPHRHNIKLKQHLIVIKREFAVAYFNVLRKEEEEEEEEEEQQQTAKPRLRRSGSRAGEKRGW